MKFLVDANVLSEGTKPTPDEGVVRWMRLNKANIVVDPIVLGEIRFGILLLPIGKRRNGLEIWFDRGIRHLNCLPWDNAVAIRWARLLADLRGAGLAMSIKDSLIAASALEHGLKIATRNEKDFRKAGVEVVNPFSDAGS